MDHGVGVMTWYVEEARRVLDGTAVSGPIVLETKLLDWLAGSWKEPFVDIRTIVQRGPNKVRDADTAKRCVDILEANGWLLRGQGKQSIPGKSRNCRRGCLAAVKAAVISSPTQTDTKNGRLS